MHTRADQRKLTLLVAQAKDALATRLHHPYMENTDGGRGCLICGKPPEDVIHNTPAVASEQVGGETEQGVDAGTDYGGGDA